VLIERIRTRRSSPSFRQIALVIVTGGLAVMVIRAATRKTKKDVSVVAVVADAPAGAPPDSPDEAQADAADEAQADSPDDDATAPTERNDTGSGNERRFTDRVQQEMSRRADAPTQAGGSGSD
jgi:hypothetical protein